MGEQILLSIIGDLDKIYQTFGPSLTLAGIFMFLLYELYSPDFLPDTKIQTTVKDFRVQISGIEQRLMGELEDVKEKQLAEIQVIRALASVSNPSEEIDDDVVDDYLIQNGIDKDDFLLGDNQNYKQVDDKYRDETRQHDPKEEIIEDD